MKLINIPPYRGVGINYSPTEGHFMVRQLIDNMRKKGQLEGVEIDIDEGCPTDHTSEAFDAVGIIKRVREISEMGKYDAITMSGGRDIGFFEARKVSKIPMAFGTHSAVHVASLIGDRFTILRFNGGGGLKFRHDVQLYGLNDKLVSIRHISRSSPFVMGLIRDYKKEERFKVPEIKKLIDDVVAQCITAIEEDRVDSIILGVPYMQCFEDEIRQGLDKADYDEIQLICAFPAAVEMAKAMVNMKLMPAPRAYPSNLLKAKPEFI